MAGNALAVLDQSRPQLPAHAQKFFDENKNVQDRISVPSLSYEGKTWAIALNGDKTKLVKKDADGDEVPVGVMRVVLLDYAKRRGRAYYEGAYDPAKPGVPVCWSTDGYVPDDDVKEKQSPKCETCPMAAKGSKVTDQGKAVTACSQHRMVAIVPANKLDFTPLRLKLAITSDYDGQSPDHEQNGWFAFSNFTDMLRSKQVQHTAMLVTKMKFDPNTAYPKVLFSVDRWLNADELETVIEKVGKPEVTSLLDGSWTPDGINGKPKGSPEATGDQPDEPAADATTTKAAKDKAQTTKPKEPETVAETAEQKAAREKAERKAAKKAEADRLAAEAAKAAAAADEDDDDGEVVLPDAGGKPATEAPKVAAGKAATATVTKAADAKKDQPKASEQPSTAVPGDVADLLADWGGDE